MIGLGTGGAPAAAAPGGLGALFQNPMIQQLLMQTGLGMMSQSGPRAPGQASVGLGQGMGMAGMAALQNLQQMQQQSFANNIMKQRFELQEKEAEKSAEYRKQMLDAELETRKQNLQLDQARMAQDAALAGQQMKAAEARYQSSQAKEAQRHTERRRTDIDDLADSFKKTHPNISDGEAQQMAREFFLRSKSSTSLLGGGFGQQPPPPPAADPDWDAVEDDANDITESLENLEPSQPPPFMGPYAPGVTPASIAREEDKKKYGLMYYTGLPQTLRGFGSLVR
jgi:hypothetical protein